jgi:hypothetical protein
MLAFAYVAAAFVVPWIGPQATYAVGGVTAGLAVFVLIRIVDCSRSTKPRGRNDRLRGDPATNRGPPAGARQVISVTGARPRTWLMFEIYDQTVFGLLAAADLHRGRDRAGRSLASVLGTGSTAGRS